MMHTKTRKCQKCGEEYSNENTKNCLSCGEVLPIKERKKITFQTIAKIISIVISMGFLVIAYLTFVRDSPNPPDIDPESILDIISFISNTDEGLVNEQMFSFTLTTNIDANATHANIGFDGGWSSPMNRTSDTTWTIDSRFTRAGTRTVTATVHDAYGNTATRTLYIEVRYSEDLNQSVEELGQGELDIISFISSPDEGLVNEQMFSFTITTNIDANATHANIEFDGGWSSPMNRTSDTTWTIDSRFTRAGTRTVTATVHDAYGNTSTRTLDIEVLYLN